MSNDILSTTEKIDGVVSRFAEELDEYIGKMKEELTSLTKAIHGLGEGWVGETYNLFRDNMTLRVKKIQAELVKAGELKNYLDEKSKVFKEILKKLGKAADK